MKLCIACSYSLMAESTLAPTETGPALFFLGLRLPRSAAEAF